MKGDDILMNNIPNKINPLPNMLLTIGLLPSSYLVSMTYEEQLLWLCNFLKTEVIPKTNANIEAVNQLITYIDNYFDNLDIQEEVNNKIDDMLESGQLQEIITEYLQINGVLGYNTVSDMVSATNIIDDSICRTLGLNTYNDGKGAFYKIRTITSGDVVDGVNIIALNISNTLIAEKMPDYYINDLQNQIDDISDNLNIINNRKYIFIGDSYGVVTEQRTIPWQQYIINKLSLTIGTNAFVSTKSSCGIIGDPNMSPISEYSFLYLLQQLENTITNKNEITDIIICGGHNDRSYSYQDLETNFISLITYIKSNYPNAKIALGWISWSNTASYLDVYASGIYKYKTLANTYGCVYLTDIENSWHYSGWLLDQVHPNNDGSEHIGQGILNYIKGNMPSENVSSKTTGTITGSNGFTISSSNFNTQLLKDVIRIYINTTFQNTNGINYTCSGSFIEIGSIENSWVMGNNDNIMNCQAMLYDGSHTYNVDGILKIASGKIYFGCYLKNNNTTTDFTVNIKSIFIQNQYFIIPTTSN